MNITSTPSKCYVLNKKIEDIVSAIIEIGRLHSTPVCDMYRNSGLNQTNLSYYTTDGVHPNDAGYVRMANLLMHELNKF